MREGVPQGGVISLTLFLLYINNITTVLPWHVSNTLHAYDLAVWSASEYTTSSAYRIQEAVNKVEQWTNDWDLQISEVKTQATVFSLSASKEKVSIKLGDKTLPQVETPTFLGVKLDTRLSWKPHIEDMEKKKGIKKLAVLKKIVWNTLGCQLQDSKNRPHGSSPTFSGIWGQRLGDSSQDAHQQTGQSSEHRLEDNPWCHENHSHSWNGETLEGRRQAKLLIHAEKMKRMPDHPLHQKLKDPTKIDRKGKVWTT